MLHQLRQLPQARLDIILAIVNNYTRPPTLFVNHHIILMTIQFIPNNQNWTKQTFWTQKLNLHTLQILMLLLNPKSFLSRNIFLIKNDFLPQKCLDPTNSCLPQFFLDLEIFLIPKLFWTQILFWTQHFFGSDQILFFFLPKIFWTQDFVWAKIFQS